MDEYFKNKLIEDIVDMDYLIETTEPFKYEYILMIICFMVGILIVYIIFCYDKQNKNQNE